MANRLKMAKIHTIQTLHESGYSNRKIAAFLDVDRGMVAKYVSQLQNPPNAPTGSKTSQESAAAVIRPGPPSCCEPFRDIIATKVE